MKTIENVDFKIHFDFKNYYKDLSNCKNEIEKIQIEAKYFNYYNSLEKNCQLEFKKLDKEV